jgi:4-carboxymuconolactone decarboxylase
MNIRHIFTILYGAVLAMVMGQVAHAQDRMPRIPADKMTEDQKEAIAEFTRLRNSPVTGSFATLLRSPELMVRASAIGEYVRRSVLPAPLYEFVVLITARHLDQQYVWDAHYQPAIAAGVATTLLAELAGGEKPSVLTDDQRILWDLLDELHQTNRVSDSTYGRALKRFGEQGVIDAVGTSGYYAFLGMVMNTAQTEGIGGAPKLKPRRQ